MTIEQLLNRGDRVALSAPDRAPLSYAGLKDLTDRTRHQLNSFGLGRGDRVALVLPNGPEAASAFVALSCSLAVAPLNPAYRVEDIAFAAHDIGAKAMVTTSESEAAIAAAHQLGLRAIQLVVPAGAPAGHFQLASAGENAVARVGMEPPGDGDVALLLHTSGTTARPKLVPLTHANLKTSAANVAMALALSPVDLCLGIMPLFHIHGLVGGLLASLSAGGGIFCTPGFNALKFFPWLREARPSWYTAVPTMHQAILARSQHNRDIINQNRLRFIRSSSAPLLTQVMDELERTFGCPAIEAYGMTEGSHQIASNPLPPGIRRGGLVGKAAGPDMAIMDEDGALVAPGTAGEIVIRGPTVMTGYEGNSDANAAAFTGGWFRTGDSGIMDSEGYLRITGRLKEIINRGGEKISPVEVDQAIADHPAVAQVVTFAIPHERLGEEVGAAVVLREGHSTTEQAIRAFVTGRIAPFKIPRKILIVEEIPAGPTGKQQRIGLAARLGLG